MSSEKFQSVDEMVSRLLREDSPIPNHAGPRPFPLKEAPIEPPAKTPISKLRPTKVTQRLDQGMFALCWPD
jgi:hypothetical protein